MSKVVTRWRRWEAVAVLALALAAGGCASPPTDPYSPGTAGYGHQNEPTSQPEDWPTIVLPPPEQPPDEADFTEGRPIPQGPVSIVFVVDKSGSMHPVFEYVKAKLRHYITQLKPDQRFALIFFADGRPEELVIDGKSGFHLAAGPAKKAAIEWVNRQIPGSKAGATDPRQALERAYRQPDRRPTFVYLLSDGRLDGDAAEVLAKLDPDDRTRFVAVVLGESDGWRVMRDLARQRKGVFRFISEKRLAEEGD